MRFFTKKNYHLVLIGMNKKSKIILGIIILALLLAIIFFPKIKSLFSSSEGPENVPNVQQRQPLSVNGIVLQYDTLVDLFLTKGILIPDEEVDLSFETSGKITHLYFKEGTHVKKDDLLAKVNDESLQAELRKLKAQLPLAEERVFRQKSLFERDAVSKEAYEAVATELDKLKADIDLVEAKIRQTELRAPFDGMIGLRQVSEGQYASPTTIISKLTKISPLKLEFSVNEKQIGEIKPGSKLSFTVENDLNLYSATVYAIESKLDEKTLSLKARAIYPNSRGLLKPGQSASIEITLKTIVNTIVIPSIASIAEMGRSIAYIYKEGKAQQVVLEKGIRTASSVQILGGLEEGDTLITTGVMQLRDGLPVKLNLN